MFFVASGYDLNSTPKSEKDKQYVHFLKSFGEVLPCFYCRESYKNFFNALDIQKYLDMPSCGLIKYVYDLKNLVNTKLKIQEQKALQSEYETLVNTYGSETSARSSPEFWKELRTKVHDICYTKEAPPYEQVVERLQRHRAACSKELKSCRKPLSPQEAAVK